MQRFPGSWNKHLVMVSSVEKVVEVSTSSSWSVIKLRFAFLQTFTKFFQIRCFNEPTPYTALTDLYSVGLGQIIGYVLLCSWNERKFI